jgi:hypothetical protein
MYFKTVKIRNYMLIYSIFFTKTLKPKWLNLLKLNTFNSYLKPIHPSVELSYAIQIVLKFLFKKKKVTLFKFDHIINYFKIKISNLKYIQFDFDTTIVNEAKLLQENPKKKPEY